MKTLKDLLDMEDVSDRFAYRVIRREAKEWINRYEKNREKYTPESEKELKEMGIDDCGGHHEDFTNAFKKFFNTEEEDLK